MTTLTQRPLLLLGVCAIAATLIALVFVVLTEDRQARASDITGRWRCDEQACQTFYRDYFTEATADDPLLARMHTELLAKHRQLEGLELEIADGVLTVRYRDHESSSPFTDSGTAANEISLLCEQALRPFPATVQILHEAGMLIIHHHGFGLVFRPIND